MQILRLWVILILISLPLMAKAEIIDQAVAIVGDRIITQYDIESFEPKKVKKIMAIKDEKIRKKALKRYYDEVKKFLIDEAVLEIAAARHGVTVSEEEVDEALDKVLKNNNISMSQLEVLLLKEKMTLAKYKLSIKKDIFQTRLRGRIISPKIVLTQEDINNKIDEMADELGLDDQFELRIIVLDKNTNIDEVKKYLREHSFADAAIKYSIDKSAKNGGYIGWIKIHSMEKSLQELIKDKTYKDIFYFNDKNGRKMLFFVEGIRSKYDIDSELRSKIVEMLKKEQFQKVYKKWFKESKEEIFIRYL